MSKSSTLARSHCQKCVRYKDYHRLEPLRDMKPMPIRDENGFYFPKHGPDYSYIMSGPPAPPPAAPRCDHRWAKAYLRRAEDLYRDVLDLALRPPPPPPPQPPPEIICTCAPNRHCCCGNGGHSSPCCCNTGPVCTPHHVIAPVYAEYAPLHSSRFFSSRSFIKLKHSPSICWPAYSNDYDWLQDCECCCHKHSPNYCRYCHEEQLKDSERHHKKYRVIAATTEREPLRVRISD